MFNTRGRRLSVEQEPKWASSCVRERVAVAAMVDFEKLAPCRSRDVTLSGSGEREIYIYMYIYTHIYIYPYSYIDISIYAYICMCM